MSINRGKARAIAASGAAPKVPITQTSVMLTKDWIKKATLLGVASAIKSPRGGALSRCWVLGAIAYCLLFLTLV